MSATNSILKGRLADMRLPFHTPTYCLRTPSIPVRSTSGTLGTWNTFKGTLTLTLAPILPASSAASSCTCSKAADDDDVAESDLRATSQDIVLLLRCTTAEEGDFTLQTSREEEEDDDDDDDEETSAFVERRRLRGEEAEKKARAFILFLSCCYLLSILISLSVSRVSLLLLFSFGFGFGFGFVTLDLIHSYPRAKVNEFTYVGFTKETAPTCRHTNPNSQPYIWGSRRFYPTATWVPPLVGEEEKETCVLGLLLGKYMFSDPKYMKYEKQPLMGKLIWELCPLCESIFSVQIAFIDFHINHYFKKKKKPILCLKFGLHFSTLSDLKFPNLIFLPLSHLSLPNRKHLKFPKMELHFTFSKIGIRILVCQKQNL